MTMSLLIDFPPSNKNDFIDCIAVSHDVTLSKFFFRFQNLLLIYLLLCIIYRIFRQRKSRSVIVRSIIERQCILISRLDFREIFYKICIVILVKKRRKKKF